MFSKALFGIVQGGLFKDLRIESISRLKAVGFEGYAMGGLAVGENQSDMFKILNETTSFLQEINQDIYGCWNTFRYFRSRK